jgi:Transposase DDE domain
MHRHQFEAYLDKVFDWSCMTAAMTEGRQFPLYPWSEAFDAVFLGSACQFGPLHRIETECRRGALHKRIGTLSEDMLGYAMQRQNPTEIFDMGCQMAQQLKRNGVLRSNWSRGRVVAAVDGIEICNSYCRCCDACLSRQVERKVKGQLQKCTQYYHRLSAVTVVSSPFPVFLGVRFQQDGETEVACSLALLKDLSEKLGRRFIDILVADALYLQAPFVGEMESLALDWVINLKDNQPDLLAETERLTAGPPQQHETTAQQDLQLWHVPEMDWPVAERVVRVVKTVRVQNAKCVKIEEHPVEAPQTAEPKTEKTESRNPKRKKRKCSRVKTKQAALLVSTNFYASNVDLGAIPPYFIHQLGRSRWTIDVQAFQTITTDCHLKRPSAHQDCALVVLTMIRVLAYTLTMVFYYRQVRSHCRGVPPGFCDMARQLAYGFLTLSSDTG